MACNEEKFRSTPTGYLLPDGTMLLQRERDGYGGYWGWADMGGIYFKTGRRYVPVRNSDGTIRAFRKVSEPENYLKNAELSQEQNYDLIDGRLDNLPSEKEPPAPKKKRDIKREKQKELER